MTKKWIVVTTINPPTVAIERISQLANAGWSVVVVGDCKSPSHWVANNIDYISIDDQKEIFGNLAGIIPFNHYCRKNLGYLYAISRGAECILETDDDNIPNNNFGQEISERVLVRLVEGPGWVNVYKYFTTEHIWPRGLPLDEIGSIGRLSGRSIEDVFPVQQYLADLDPDVDAVYRLIVNKELTFDQNKPVGLEIGCWVPFNSQNTLFYKQSFPLLYLPCHVSFRMTDIWRSFVAQQALWIFGHRVAFLPATVKQIRNQHDLMRDFTDEIPGYLNNKRITNILSDCALNLTPSMGMNFVARSLWESLHSAGIIPDEEMSILDAWMGALSKTIKE